MKRSFILAFAIQLSVFLILTSCSGKKSTNKVDDSQYDLPVKMILNSDGTGQVWIEDYGRLEDGSPSDLIWHTSGNQFVIQLEGEDEGTSIYTLNENVLSLLFADDELIFVRR